MRLRTIAYTTKEKALKEILLEKLQSHFESEGREVRTNLLKRSICIHRGSFQDLKPISSLSKENGNGGDSVPKSELPENPRAQGPEAYFRSNGDYWSQTQKNPEHEPPLSGIRKPRLVIHLLLISSETTKEPSVFQIQFTQGKIETLYIDRVIVDQSISIIESHPSGLGFGVCVLALNSLNNLKPTTFRKGNIF